jgi:hypothetical protein
MFTIGETYRLRMLEDGTFIEHFNSRAVAVEMPLVKFGAFSSENMPTRGMRKLWIAVVETMLKIENSTATPDQVWALRQQIGQLRKAIRDHEAGIDR